MTLFVIVIIILKYYYDDSSIKKELMSTEATLKPPCFVIIKQTLERDN